MIPGWARCCDVGFTAVLAVPVVQMGTGQPARYMLPTTLVDADVEHVGGVDLEDWIVRPCRVADT